MRPVAIVGPTASGKTAVACELAERLGAEIISADSMAVYRGMDIGTAKPTSSERARAVFHLIDVADPDEPFTVVDFQERAVAVIDELLGRGRLPLIVGGTGLYIRAVLDGLNIPGPEPDPEVRERLRREAEELGSEAMHSRLAEVDPETAARLHPNNTRRVIRALEVYEQSGRPMSEILRATKAPPRYPDALEFGLTMDRETLYRRVEERVDLMIAQGLVDEVAGLLEKDYTTEAPAMQGLGYKEIAAYLQGKCDLAGAVDLLKQSTRRFAKRQYTWFRADARIHWINIDALSATEAASIIEAKLRDEGVLGQDVG